MDAAQLKSAIINLLSQTEDMDALNSVYSVLYSRVNGTDPGTGNFVAGDIETNDEGYPMNSGTFTFRMRDPKDKPGK